MKKKSSKATSNRSVNPLEQFAKVAKAAFIFLKQELGLNQYSEQINAPEVMLTFESELIRVRIFYECPSAMWLVVERRANDKWKSQGLHQILKQIGKTIPTQISRVRSIDESIEYFVSVVSKHWGIISGNEATRKID